MSKKIIDACPFWVDNLTGVTYENKAQIPKQHVSRCTHWDSQLEYKIFLTLQKLVPTSVIFAHDKQVIVPKSVNLPALTWEIDFVVSTNKGLKYIEGKGKWIEKYDLEFWKLLKIVEQARPDIANNLYFIGSNKDGEWTIPNSKIKVTPINQMQELIETWL